MKLNCKTGDLAIVVESDLGNEGKIVQCIKFIGDIAQRDSNGNIETVPMWEVDRDLDGEGGNEIADYQLRPIRDSDGEDETLTWAGKPEGVTA